MQLCRQGYSNPHAHLLMHPTHTQNVQLSALPSLPAPYAGTLAQSYQMVASRVRVASSGAPALLVATVTNPPAAAR